MKNSSKILSKTSRKKYVPESLFNNVAGIHDTYKICKIIKKSSFEEDLDGIVSMVPSLLTFNTYVLVFLLLSLYKYT